MLVSFFFFEKCSVLLKPGYLSMLSPPPLVRLSGHNCLCVRIYKYEYKGRLYVITPHMTSSGQYQCLTDPPYICHQRLALIYLPWARITLSSLFQPLYFPPSFLPLPFFRDLSAASTDFRPASLALGSSLRERKSGAVSQSSPPILGQTNL